MIDFETLGTKPNSVVLSLGAVLFNEEKVLGEFYRAFDIDNQPNRVRQADTIEWWGKQTPEAREIFQECKYGTPLDLLPAGFTEFVGYNKVKIWSNGSDFDIPILVNIYESFGQKVPWKFWDHRCYRTIKSLFHIEKTVQFTGVKHNALEDARYQARCLHQFLFQKKTSTGVIGMSL